MLLGFSLMLLLGMFISNYTITYVFVNNFFFFECLYFSAYDIRMFLFVFWLRNRPSINYVSNKGNGGGWSKIFPDAYRGRGVSRFMCTYALTLSLFMFFHVFSCFYFISIFTDIVLYWLLLLLLLLNVIAVAVSFVTQNW